MTETTRPETPQRTRARKDAEPEPPPAEEQHPEPPPVAPPMITPDQMKYLHVLLRDQAGLTERADVLDYLSVLVGREVESRKDLTRDEAGNVIDHMQTVDAPVDKRPTVLQAILAVKRDMPAIGRTQRNVDQGYTFRGIDDVMAALSPTMTKHGVTYVPDVLDVQVTERPTRSGGSQIMVIARVHWAIYGPAGDFIEAVTYGQGLDTSDKSVNKAATAAEKYMLTQVFAIPTRDYDADQFSPQIEGPHHHDQQPQSPAPNMPTTAELLERLDGYARDQGIDREAITGKWRHENGDMPVEQLERLQPEVLFPLVRQIGLWIENQRRQAADQPYG